MENCNVNNEKRLLSLDTLRGFNMMFIMGMAALIYAICSLFPGGADSWLALQMEHAEWEGLRHHDTIFPMFLFLAGVAFPFSYAKRKSRGLQQGKITLMVLKRGFVLFFLGLVYNGFFMLDFTHLRIFSVLSRIGFAWMFAALIHMYCKPKARIVLSVIFLVGYYLLLRFVPAPDHVGAGPFSLEGNIVGYVDRTLFGNNIYRPGLYDPEGLLSVIPAIVTALLGMFTGDFVRLPEEKVSGGRKTLYMFATAAVLAVAGLLWSKLFPINKALWSSTFVLTVGAISIASFALFYYVIEVRGWRKWTKFFEVIGRNPITIYLAQAIVSFDSISKFFLGGLAGKCSPEWSTVILTAGYFAVCWLFLYFLYRKNTFLKV